MREWEITIRTNNGKAVRNFPVFASSRDGAMRRAREAMAGSKVSNWYAEIEEI